MAESARSRFDIVICGGGFVGLALARALTVLAPGAFKIAVIERRPLSAEAASQDSRAVALTAAVKAMFEVIGVWPALEGFAQPIRKIELTDSALEAPIRPSLIGLDAAQTASGKPTAYIVENAELFRGLYVAIVDSEAVSILAPESIASFDASDCEISIALASGASIAASLLVAADGRNSALRKAAGIATADWPSAKVGIVATVGIGRPHEGVARQHFLPAGPFAVLPMTGNRVSLVWTEEAGNAKRIIGLDREQILEEISLRLGNELGTLTLLTEPKAHSLAMTLAREFVRSRFALVGDAAHALHWIAGQGLNHGLKDVAALTETLIDAKRLGLDIGSLTVLKRYERWRRFDSTTSAFTARAIDGVFSNDSAALRMLRSAGLRAADKLNPLKSFLMKEAAGLTGRVPKLLRGEGV